MLFHKYISSPIGYLLITTNEIQLVSVSFRDKTENNSPDLPLIVQQTEEQLNEYFLGKRKYFKLKLKPKGTDFQKAVWSFVEKVNYGRTASYLEIANLSGDKNNTRAVGMANGKNPIPIIIPCHRIIGSSGKLTGYAGGIEIKRWLLQHEMKNSKNNSLLF